MQKWNYKTLPWKRDRDVSDALTTSGEDGWELVLSYMNGAGETVFIFKKPQR